MGDFYTKVVRVRGVAVRAHEVVSDEALLEAARRLGNLLCRSNAIRDNLCRAGAELHVVGRGQKVTDLPMYRHLAGIPVIGGLTMDERGRGYGGLHACVDEDSLLRLPSARHADHRDVCSHEIAHTVERYGLDAPLRAAVRRRWEEALTEGRWNGAYAATNPHEFFAELTMWYVGSRGDHGTLPSPPADGPEGLRAYDPASFALLDDLWSGRRTPRPIQWVELEPTRAGRSGSDRRKTSIVVHNHTGATVHLLWLDFEGRPVDYGPVAPEGIRDQPTYVGHAWVLADGEGRHHGPYVATAEPGRILLARVANRGGTVGA